MTARRLLPIAFAAWLALALPVRAIEPDRYLPNDTDAVVTFNVQQMLASPLVKTHYLAYFQELLGANGELPKLARELGFDPLKDLQQVLFSNGESLYRLTRRQVQGKTVYDSEGGYFCLLKGRFDVPKFRAAFERLAKEKGGIAVKPQKVGTQFVYEVDLGRTLFVALLDGSSVAVSSRSEPIVEAVEKALGKRKAVLKYKEFATALGRIDGKKSAGVAAIANAGFGLDVDIKKVGGKLVETPVKQTLAQSGIDSISGTIDMTDGISAEVIVGLRGTAAAKDVLDSFQKDLNSTIEAAVEAWRNNPRLGPLAVFARSLTTMAKDKTVLIQANVNAKEVADSLK